MIVHKTQMLAHADLIFAKGKFLHIYRMIQMKDVLVNNNFHKYHTFKLMVNFHTHIFRDNVCIKNGSDCTPKSLCWPKDWLPMDIPSLRLIGINYDTSLSMWTPFCPIQNKK